MTLGEMIMNDNVEEIFKQAHEKILNDVEMTDVEAIVFGGELIRKMNEVSALVRNGEGQADFSFKPYGDVWQLYAELSESKNNMAKVYPVIKYNVVAFTNSNSAYSLYF